MIIQKENSKHKDVKKSLTLGVNNFYSSLLILKWFSATQLISITPRI